MFTLQGRWLGASRAGMSFLIKLFGPVSYTIFYYLKMSKTEPVHQSAQQIIISMTLCCMYMLNFSHTEDALWDGGGRAVTPAAHDWKRLDRS